MIVKNCGGVTCLETCQREVLGETQFCSLNIKLSTDTVTSLSVQENNLALCSKEQGANENSSRDLSLFHPQLQKDSEKMSEISVKVIEKLSELSLEDSNKSAIGVDDKNFLQGQKDNDRKAELSQIKSTLKDLSQQLPVATISVKEKDKETVCLSCITGRNVCHEKSKLCPQEKVDRPKKNLPSNILLIERSPHRNGRIHCQTSTNPMQSVTRIPTQKQLHGCGGTFTEINPSVNSGANLNVIDQEYYIEQLLSPPPESNTSSVGDQPSSFDYLSSSSSSSIGSPLPCISSLFPTPPHSINDSAFSPLSEFQYSPASEIQHSPLFDEQDELNVLSPASSEQEQKNEILKYLVSGDIDPAIAEIVKNIENGINSNSSESNSASLSGSEVTAAKVTSSVNFSQVSNCTFGDTSLVSQSVIFVPAQMQTITAVSEQKDRRNQMTLKQRSILPKTEISDRKPVQLEQNAQNKSACTKKNKSVKLEICSKISLAEKNQLIKEMLKKQPLNDGKTKLHLAVLEGNEKLAYTVIESTKRFLKNNNSSNSEKNLRKEMQIFVNKQDVYGCTALYYSVLGENKMLTAYLLECGGDPFIKDNKNGNTAFHVMTVKGDDGIVMFELLSYCRNNIEDLQNNKGQTILSAAILNHGRLYNGKRIRGLKLIEHLLKNNHKVSIQDSEGKTALHLAVLRKDIEVLEVLLRCSVDARNAKMVQDNEGNTILHYAAMLFNIESNMHETLIKIIISHCPALTTVKNKKGQLPYNIINESLTEMKKLLKCSIDEYGFRDL